jgi:hypothetical protein
MKQLPQELQDKIFLYLDYDTLKKCRELQSEFVKSTTQNANFEDAARNGNLRNLKWLKNKGNPWTYFTFIFAVENENLEILKWLKNQGCPWDTFAFSYAAEKGQLSGFKMVKI